MKKLIFLLLILLLVLQWRWWFGDGGIHEVRRYQREVERLAGVLEQQTDINRALAAEVRDLKEGLGEIEARARSELGMIREDETFYQFVGDQENRVTPEESDPLAPPEAEQTQPAEPSGG